ncbi:MAG: hypothetical protein IJB74_01800 [Clostridia bacterium]|nr:hypothetical protein [Clostridia bacterium]
MRNYLSVFFVQIKSTFNKIMAVILLMGMAQLGLFIHILNSGDIIIPNSFTNERFLSGLEGILLDNRAMSFIFASGFLLITVILAINGCKYTSREDYTLRRLNITEKKVMLTKGIYGIFVFSLLLMAEAFVMYIICNIYIYFAENHPQTFEGSVSNQTVFLSFYRSSLIHSVLPLEDYLKYISTFFTIVGMSFSTASIPYFVKRKKLFLETFILVPAVIINFTSAWTAGLAADLALIGVSGFILGILITRISTEEQTYDG